MKVVAIVGMAGSGKSEAAKVLVEAGYTRVRFGQITEDEIIRRRLPVNEENERFIRELFRKEHGMAAYAKLNLPRIDAALKTTNVAADGLYSWEEYLMLSSYYGKDFCVVAVNASPATRYRRLATRRDRPLTPEQAAVRDKAEIENVNKGGPIAMADYTIVNEFTVGDLREQTRRVLKKINERNS